MLRLGSRGNNVAKLQRNLNTLGYHCGKVDGIFGRSTKISVEKFQRNHGLSQDGIVGPDTESAIDYAVKFEYEVALKSNHLGFTELLHLSFTPCEWFLGGSVNKNLCNNRISISYRYGLIKQASSHGSFNLYNFDINQFNISSDSGIKFSLKDISKKLARKLNSYGIDDVSFSSGSISIDASGISLEGVKISNYFLLGPYKNFSRKYEDLSISAKLSWNDIAKLTGAAAVIVGLCLLATCAPGVAASLSGVATNFVINNLNKLCSNI